MTKQVRILKNDSDAGGAKPIAGFLSGRLFAAHMYAAAIRHRKKTRDSENRCLSGTGIALNSKNFPTLQRKGYRSENEPAVFVPCITFRHVVEDENAAFDVPHHNGAAPIYRRNR